MKYMLDLLGQTKCGDRKSASEFAEKEIKRRELNGARDFVKHFTSIGIKSFIATIGCDIVADAARRYFECDDSIGNPVVYYDLYFVEPSGLAIRRSRNPTIKSCELIIKDNKEKLEQTEKMLKKYGLTITNCFAVGNDKSDHAVMGEAKVAIASPLADDETKEFVKKLGGILIRGYKEFLDFLKNPASG